MIWAIRFCFQFKSSHLLCTVPVFIFKSDSSRIHFRWGASERFRFSHSPPDGSACVPHVLLCILRDLKCHIVTYLLPIPVWLAVDLSGGSIHEPAPQASIAVASWVPPPASTGDFLCRKVWFLSKIVLYLYINLGLISGHPCDSACPCWRPPHCSTHLILLSHGSILRLSSNESCVLCPLVYS